METISLSELGANLMKAIKVIELGSSINITSGGKVIAKLVPPDHKREIARKKLDEIGKNAVLHDIISPIDTQWEVMK